MMQGKAINKGTYPTGVKLQNMLVIFDCVMIGIMFIISDYHPIITNIQIHKFCCWVMSQI